MHFVVDQMVQFEHMHVTNSHRAIKCLTSASVVQRDLAGLRKTGQSEHVLDLALGCAVEHRCRKRDPVPQVAREFANLRVVERGEFLLRANILVKRFDETAGSATFACCLSMASILLPMPRAAQPR